MQLTNEMIGGLEATESVVTFLISDLEPSLLDVNPNTWIKYLRAGSEIVLHL